MKLPLPRKKLPIGIQTFREIREEGHYYVDKTGLALRLIDECKFYFLSRPCRFGKSLLLDTHQDSDQPFHLIGVVFSTATRSVVGFGVQSHPSSALNQAAPG